MTEKGLDLVPMIFEMILWSHKYDSHSEARRITKLVQLIQRDNRKISHKLRDKIRRGEGIVRDFLD